MHWSRWFSLVVLVPLAISGATFARASDEPPREKVIEAPHGIQVRLMTGAFDELDTLAKGYRSSHVRLAGGYSALMNLYAVLTRFDDGGCASKPAQCYSFDDKRLAMERWLAGRPESLTARIALALLWKQYAWVGRGNDTADKTSDAQWSAFKERMARARELLEPLDFDLDPEIYLIEMGATAASERPKDRLLNLYERATLAYPNIYEFAAPRFYFTLPRWHGEPGEAAAFTQSLLTVPGGEAGLMAYFNVAGETLMTEHHLEAIFEVSGTQYPLLLKAFAAREAAFGVTKNDMNVLMYYAIAAQDCGTINPLIEKIGDDWNYSIWTNKEFVDSMLALLRQKCPRG
jgi:hypothetical protein